MQTGQTIDKTIHIHAPAKMVWDALTTPQIMKRWMSDFDMDISTNWQVGSPIHVHGDLHGIAFQNKGTVLKFEPEKLLQFTYWSSLSEQADIPGNYSVIIFRLIPTENGTTLHLEQCNFIAFTTYKHWEFYWRTTLHILKQITEEMQLDKSHI